MLRYQSNIVSQPNPRNAYFWAVKQTFYGKQPVGSETCVKGRRLSILVFMNERPRGGREGGKWRSEVILGRREGNSSRGGR